MKPSLNEASTAPAGTGAMGAGRSILLSASVVLAWVSPGAPSEAERGLIEAARQGNLARVRALVEARVDVNAATASGTTALMEAAAAGRNDIARVLIDAGAEVDVRDRLGRTALDLALRAGQAPMVRLLRSRGAVGSGRSPGDTVCVKKWQGEGFCGVVEGVGPSRLRVRVTRVEGCVGGCAAGDVCSAGEPVNGPSESLGKLLWVPSSCLTQTYPGSGR
jgi:ankyrin repeat protein